MLQYLEYAPKILKKIRQNMNVRALANRTYKALDMYSFHGSLVERPQPIKGARVQSQGISIYLNSGFQHHKMKMLACNCYTVTNLAGHFNY